MPRRRTAGRPEGCCGWRAARRVHPTPRTTPAAPTAGRGPCASRSSGRAGRRPCGQPATLGRMADLKLGLSTGYWSSGPPPGAAEAVAEAERLGFDSVWTAEAYGSDALT